MAPSYSPWSQGRIWLNDKERPDSEIKMKLTVKAVGAGTGVSSQTNEDPLTSKPGEEYQSDDDIDGDNESIDYGPLTHGYEGGLDDYGVHYDLSDIGHKGCGNDASGLAPKFDKISDHSHASRENLDEQQSDGDESDLDEEWAGHELLLGQECPTNFSTVVIRPEDEKAMTHLKKWVRKVTHLGLYNPKTQLLHPKAFREKYAPFVPGAYSGEDVHEAISSGLKFNGEAFITNKSWPHRRYLSENSLFDCMCSDKSGCNLCLANARVNFLARSLGASRQTARRSTTAAANALRDKKEAQRDSRVAQSEMDDLKAANGRLQRQLRAEADRLGRQLRSEADRLTHELRAEISCLRERLQPNHNIHSESPRSDPNPTPKSNRTCRVGKSPEAIVVDDSKTNAATSPEPNSPQQSFKSAPDSSRRGGKAKSGPSRKRSYSTLVSADNEEAEEDNDGDNDGDNDDDDGDFYQPSERSSKRQTLLPSGATKIEATRDKNSKSVRPGVWTEDEKEHIADVVINQVADQNAGTIPKLYDAHLWAFVSLELKRRFGMERPANGCKMYWCRLGRQAHGIDERDPNKKRNKDLQTSVQ
ncbi:MAG: hypothetical protein M1818_004699 [Claussenomyces sp. TS43310]|nr:MAG: hypothetical protein M1818_004699 [Claussenomyces sp. TS43310]